MVFKDFLKFMLSYSVDSQRKFIIHYSKKIIKPFLDYNQIKSSCRLYE